ncbi:MAG: ion transporter [Butyrivibrio sp.]|nr:ion transporter [Butyrivibrio sp.]
MVRTFRVFRVFKAFRYSKSIRIIAKVIANSKNALVAVCTLAIGYILVSALIMFNEKAATLLKRDSLFL